MTKKRRPTFGRTDSTGRITDTDRVNWLSALLWTTWDCDELHEVRIRNQGKPYSLREAINAAILASRRK